MKSLNVPEGQRKLIVTIITMVVGIVADKYFGGLSDNLAILIGSSLAIFVGGNAMEYVAQIKGKAQPISPQISEAPQKEQAVDVPQDPIEKISAQLNQLDQICGQVFAKYDKQFVDLNAAIGRQNNSIKGMLDIINKPAKGFSDDTDF